MRRRTSRCTIFALLLALLFQLGAAAAAGLPSQSCCGTCDSIAAQPAAQHCDDAVANVHRHDPAPAHRHGSGPCPLCGDHGLAMAPFVLSAAATVPCVTAPALVAHVAPPALPAPMPDRLERPPRLA